MAGQTLEQRAAAAQLVANRLRHQVSENRRARDARRKIVIGGTVLMAMADDDDLRGKVLHLLRENVTRAEDIAVIADLLGIAAPVAPSDGQDGVAASPPDAGG